MMEFWRFIKETWVRNRKICHFWAKHVKGYRYPKLVSVPIVERGCGTGTKILGTSTH